MTVNKLIGVHTYCGGLPCVAMSPCICCRQHWTSGSSRTLISTPGWGHSHRSSPADVLINSAGAESAQPGWGMQVSCYAFAMRCSCLDVISQTCMWRPCWKAERRIDSHLHRCMAQDRWTGRRNRSQSRTVPHIAESRIPPVAHSAQSIVEH